MQSFRSRIYYYLSDSLGIFVRFWRIRCKVKKKKPSKTNELAGCLLFHELMTAPKWAIIQSAIYQRARYSFFFCFQSGFRRNYIIYYVNHRKSFYFTVGDKSISLPFLCWIPVQNELNGEKKTMLHFAILIPFRMKMTTNRIIRMEQMK